MGKTTAELFLQSLDYNSVEAIVRGESENLQKKCKSIPETAEKLLTNNCDAFQFLVRLLTY